MDEGWAVIIAAAMAIVGILYSSRQQRKLLRKQHTYAVLDKMNDWKKLDDDLEFASKLIKAGQVPRLCDDQNESACERIDFLLNHYEFLSAAIISGDIDEGLVRKVEELRLTRLFLKFMDYIAENREDRGTNMMWENLEYMCHRWTVAKDDKYQDMLDRALLRPALASFQVVRPSVWEDLARHRQTLA
jgi:hypothetical protein